jgi:hypothetical protein
MKEGRGMGWGGGGDERGKRGRGRGRKKKEEAGMLFFLYPSALSPLPIKDSKIQPLSCFVYTRMRLGSAKLSLAQTKTEKSATPTAIPSRRRTGAWRTVSSNTLQVTVANLKSTSQLEKKERRRKVRLSGTAIGTITMANKN